MKKVVVISTGGTIAMKYDPEIGADVPAVTGDELVEAVPPLKDVADIEVVEFSNIPSPHMTPEIMFDLRNKIEEVLSDDEVDGVVVTHGTDTVEETSYFLQLSLTTEKPVALTAAMRSNTDMSPDGPMNILCAVRTVVDEGAKDKGVVVVLNNEIHSAQDVNKTHSANLAAFASPFWGPIGYVDNDRIIWKRNIIREASLIPKEITKTDVHILTLAAGTDDYLINVLVDKGADGIIIEGLGRGNVPPKVIDGIKRATEAGIPVIDLSRCLGGRPLDVYGYPGGGQKVLQAGAIFGGEMVGAKARIKLILALNALDNPTTEELSEYFDVY